LNNQPQANAQELERIALVVQFDEETAFAGCLDISGQELTGQDVLQLAGLDLDLYYNASQEAAVCRINELGCESDQCFCQFPDYWSYWHLEGNEWVYSGRGASIYLTQPGSVEGWRWGSGAPPLPITFEQICSPSAQGRSLAPIGGGGQADDGIRLLPLKPDAVLPDSDQNTAIQRPPDILPVTYGYLVFGAALVSMGVGWILLMKKRRG
jgi:hypothetical protein